MQITSNNHSLICSRILTDLYFYCRIDDDANSKHGLDDGDDDPVEVRSASVIDIKDTEERPSSSGNS